MMRISLSRPGGLLLVGLLLAGCQSEEQPLAADLNSATPAIAIQAGKVQALTTQLDQQKATIKAEKTKLTAIREQLDGARQNLDGLKMQARAK